MLNDNSDILFDIAHDPEVWKATFCTENGMRKALENRGEGFNIKRRPYATEEAKKAFIERFKRDGFEAPVCCKLISSIFTERQGQSTKEKRCRECAVIEKLM